MGGFGLWVKGFDGWVSSIFMAGLQGIGGFLADGERILEVGCLWLGDG